MSENIGIRIQLKNRFVKTQNTTGLITKQSDDLKWGKWSVDMPTQIKAGGDDYGIAEGRKATGTGTEGSVVYMLPDNATTIKISFDIPYSGANTGGMTMTGPNASNYVARETTDNYETRVGFPNGTKPTAYFIVGLESVVGHAASLFDVAAAVRQRIARLSTTTARETVTLPAAAWAIGCGRYTGEELIKVFKGQTSATVQEVLATRRATADEVVQFVAKLNLVPPRLAFEASLDFAEHVLETLESDPQAHDLAQRLLTSLRSLLQGDEGGDLNEYTDGLENVKAKWRALGVIAGSRLTQLAAIEAVLAPAFMGPGAALMQAGSCARRTAGDDERRYHEIAEWQLRYLRDRLKQPAGKRSQVVVERSSAPSKGKSAPASKSSLARA